MLYNTPVVQQMNMSFIIKSQGSGTPETVIPLNPSCDISSQCSVNFIGSGCLTETQNDVAYTVHYFIPNLSCSELEDDTPCTVKVEENILSCAASACIDTSCNNQEGSIIICSGILPSLQCDDIDPGDVVVECTSPSDSANCSTN